MDLTKMMTTLVKEQSARDKRQPRTHYATVSRVESDGTAWAVVDGNDASTPCSCGVACSAGDRVTVRVEGNRALVTGNLSASATGEDSESKTTTSATAGFYANAGNVASVTAQSFHRCVDVVQFRIVVTLAQDLATGTEMALGILPDGYRPIDAIGASAHHINRRARVGTSGTVYVATTTQVTAGSQITVSGTFIAPPLG